MRLFDIFQKNTAPAMPDPSMQSEQQGDGEEYVVETFVPKKIPMTGELLRRQREEEIRKKYCRPTVKTGVMK
jgi:hypothetical protein